MKIILFILLLQPVKIHIWYAGNDHKAVIENYAKQAMYNELESNAIVCINKSDTVYLEISMNDKNELMYSPDVKITLVEETE